MNFKTPLHRPVLRENCVHLWRAVISPVSGEFTEICRSALSDDERARARRFYAPVARETFEAGRGILRTLLGLYLGKDPAEIAFEYGAHGKPVLAGQKGRDALHFSVSHAGGVALYAFGIGMPVGVDIERIRTGLDIAALAKRFLSPAETAQFMALPKTQRKEAFYACWTRKEAVLKAKGIGILPGLREVDVVFLPGLKPGLLRCSWRGERPQLWSLRDIDAGRGFRAALAVKTPRPGISCYRWTYCRNALSP